MKTVYVGQELPSRGHCRETTHNSVFLAGPTPRSDDQPSWRPDALRILDEQGFDGHVFVPEAEGGGGWHGVYEDQVHWEWEALGRSACVLFWVPRDLAKMPGFSTNVEFGMMMALAPNRVILGSPPGTPKMRYLYKTLSDVWTFHKQFEHKVSYLGAPDQADSLKSCLILAMSVASQNG